MKKLLFLLVIMSFLSCEDECDNSRDEYNKAKTEHEKKMADAKDLIAQLELFDLEDEQQIQQYELVNDELGVILIEIAMLEIVMEDIKKNDFQCSF
jgi:hypothetical protein